MPNKETIYDDKTGLLRPERPGNPLTALTQKAAIPHREVIAETCINPINYFKRIKNNIQLYWKTDSHWNPNGCYAAYQLVCSKLKIPPLKDLLFRPFSEGMVEMDLGGKICPKIKEKVRFYDFCQNASCSETNELIKFKKKHKLENEPLLHVGSSITYVNPEAPQKLKVVIFGDSFSEYRPALLTGMLAETFSETNFVWSTSIDYAYIDEINPDIIITEIVERFMPAVPTDKFDLKMFTAESIESFIHKQDGGTL